MKSRDSVGEGLVAEESPPLQVRRSETQNGKQTQRTLEIQVRFWVRTRRSVRKTRTVERVAPGIIGKTTTYRRLTLANSSSCQWVVSSSRPQSSDSDVDGVLDHPPGQQKGNGIIAGEDGSLGLSDSDSARTALLAM